MLLPSTCWDLIFHFLCSAGCWTRLFKLAVQYLPLILWCLHLDLYIFLQFTNNLDQRSSLWKGWWVLSLSQANTCAFLKTEGIKSSLYKGNQFIVYLYCYIFKACNFKYIPFFIMSIRWNKFEIDPSKELCSITS